MIRRQPKTRWLRELKDRRRREEREAIATVRPIVMNRDGRCRLVLTMAMGPCKGPTQWAHFGDSKRFKTRRMAASERHTTEGSLALCDRHHDLYDANELVIEALTERRCDGPLRFRMGDSVYEET